MTIQSHSWLIEGTPRDSRLGAPPVGGDPGDFSLLGNPSFNANSLTSTQRLWYDRMWAGINRGITNNSPIIPINSYTLSDDLYEISRHGNEYVSALLIALRATGDLRVLDEVDRLAQRMRSTLRDGNCDGSGKDGHLNWRWRQDPNWELYCTGWHRMDATLMHSYLAEVAYAFEVNRNLSSPSGVNYAERADFWKNYLKNHFEAAWRKYRNIPWPRMDFVINTGFHPEVDFLRYYYFMHKLYGQVEYYNYFLTRTNDFTNTLRVQNTEPGGFQMMPTPWGNAALWSQTAPKASWTVYTGSNAGRDSREGQAFVYYKSSIMAPASLTLEKAQGWADGSMMAAIGVSSAYYVMDTDNMAASNPFARGINGESVVAHPSQGWSFNVNQHSTGRGTLTRFSSSSYSSPLAFMPQGTARNRFKTITEAAYNQFTGSSDRENPRDFRIPAYMLLDAMRNP